MPSIRKALGIAIVGMLFGTSDAGYAHSVKRHSAHFRAQEAETTRTSAEAANAALLRSWYETVLGPLDPEPVDTFLAPDFVQHSKLAQPGPEGVKNFVRQMRGLWRRPRLTILRIFADGDFVVGQVHQERFEGDPGLNIVNIYRVENGRLKEHWGNLQAVEGNPLGK